MEHLDPLIGDMTLNQLANPGSHDSGTSDLSSRISPDLDSKGPDWLIKLIDKVGSPLAGKFIRDIAQTQILDLAGQLDNGIRFLDFRLCVNSTSAPKQWYVWHGVMSGTPAIELLEPVRTWLQSNNETIVIFMSHHGDESCTGASCYGKHATAADQLSFWRLVEALFGCNNAADDCMLADRTTTPVNSTTLRQLRAGGSRVIVYASGWSAMTNGSAYAYDSSKQVTQTISTISGDLSNGQMYGADALDDWRAGPVAHKQLDMKQTFSYSTQVRSDLQPEGQLFLFSVANTIPDAAPPCMWLIRSVPLWPTKKCASHQANISGFIEPVSTLLDYGRLVNYYQQAAYNQNTSLPHILYADGIVADGRVAVNGTLSSPYVAHILAWNVAQTKCQTAECIKLQAEVNALARDPIYWDDIAHGYSSSMPPAPWTLSEVATMDEHY